MLFLHLLTSCYQSYMFCLSINTTIKPRLSLMVDGRKRHTNLLTAQGASYFSQGIHFIATCTTPYTTLHFTSLVRAKVLSKKVCKYLRIDTSKCRT